MVLHVNNACLCEPALGVGVYMMLPQCVLLMIAHLSVHLGKHTLRYVIANTPASKHVLACAVQHMSTHAERAVSRVTRASPDTCPGLA
eukprot:2765747-Alexandrium_andersonii.AAC.1